MKKARKNHKEEYDKYYLESLPISSRGIISTAMELAYDSLDNEAIALDIGCGAGILTNMVAQRTSMIIGIDISITAIRKTKRSIKKANVEFVVCDAELLPFRNEIFDIIVSTETFEHLLEPLNCFNEIKRCKKRNGEVVFSVPNYLNLYGCIRTIQDRTIGKLFRLRWGLVQPVDNFFTIRNLTKLCNRAKLRRIETISLDRLPWTVLEGVFHYFSFYFKGSIVHKISKGIYYRFISKYLEITRPQIFRKTLLKYMGTTIFLKLI